MFVWIRALDAKIENTVSYSGGRNVDTPQAFAGQLIKYVCMYVRVYDGRFVKAMEFIGGFHLTLSIRASITVNWTFFLSLTLLETLKLRLNAWIEWMADSWPTIVVVIHRVSNP